MHLQMPWYLMGASSTWTSCVTFLHISLISSGENWIQQCSDTMMCSAHLNSVLERQLWQTSDGDPCSFFSFASCLSSFSALSFLLLDLWHDSFDLSLLDALDTLHLEHFFFLRSSLGPLHLGKCFLICWPEDAANSRHFPQEKLLQ